MESVIENQKSKIAAALVDLVNRPLDEAAIALFETLGFTPASSETSRNYRRTNRRS